jgi:hypothetical protein
MMGVLDRLEKTKIRDLLGKGWLTHDGMWFYNTCHKLGIEKANELNRAAIKSLAPIEVDRIKRILGVSLKKFETVDELMKFVLPALELTLPDSVLKNFHLTTYSGELIRWKWENSQCFAYKGMKQMGMIDGYHCGVMYRIECWLDALGAGYSMQPVIEGCLMHEKGTCEGEIQVFLNG